MACNECNNPYTGCTVCNSSSHCSCSCPSTTDACDCPTKDVSTDCSVYTGDDLVNSGITQNTILTEVIQGLDSFVQNKFDEAIQYLTLVNIGTGAEVFAGISGIGNKELRSISQGADIIVTEQTDSILISNPSATELIKGVAQIATQVEVDAGANTEKYVTPATLLTSVTNIISDPLNLPNATESQRGIIELATQLEVTAGLDTEKAVTPATLVTYVTDPVNLPDSTETQRGIIELATQAEVDTGTDTEKAVTPATLSTNVTNIISNPVNLPDSTETQRGVIELATQAEVDAGTDTEKAVTPATLDQFIFGGGGGAITIPIGLIAMWSGDPGVLPTGWSLCDGTGGTPDLRSRFVVGFDLSNPDYNTVGNTGGSDEVTLTVDEIPPHSHTIDAFRNDQQSVDNGGGSVVADQQANATVGTTGGGMPHENRPPYYAIAFIMYTG